MKKGQIIKLIGGLYELVDSESKEILTAKASGKLRYVRLSSDSSFQKRYTKSKKFETKYAQVSPKVGDWVKYDEVDGLHPIQEILPRMNELERPDVANVDQVLILNAIVKPTFSFNLLDQFLILIEKANIKPILIVSKIDLVLKNELEALQSQLAYYEKIGYTIYYVNSKQKIGFDVLEDIFKDKISVLAGQTGAGKTTFLNALMPELGLKTQEISTALGRGKHTTRHTMLYRYGGGMIADTPGFSKLELDIFEKEDLKSYFIEFKQYESECKFGSKCTHTHEPGCAIKNNSEILPSRYQNYLKYYEEIENQKERY